MTGQCWLIGPGDGEPIEADATALVDALIALRTAWRADNGVYSVRVMQAFGAVIRETETVIDFGEGGDERHA